MLVKRYYTKIGLCYILIIYKWESKSYFDIMIVCVNVTCFSVDLKVKFYMFEKWPNNETIIKLSM